ncbi:MAG: ROK family protein [Trueperaceae bacterium]|nr:ROK family protein [Trueperaceae bacterium]
MTSSVPHDAGLAIGIDVGGTKTAAALVDLATGALRARREEPTRPERQGREVLDDTLALARHLLSLPRPPDRPFRGIGVGVAELVDLRGHVITGHTVRWAGLPVRARLAEVAPTFVDADVRAAARAEAIFGAGRGHDDFVYVSIGTGISSCLVLNGTPYPGAHGRAGVLGTGVRRDASRSLEARASGPALVRRYRLASGQDTTHGRDVAHLAANGDVHAQAVLDEAADALGDALAWLVDVLDPAVLIVGGGLGTSGGRYWNRLVRATRQGIWTPGSRDVPVLPAATGTDAGVLGAALGTLAHTQDGPSLSLHAPAQEGDPHAPCG